MRRTTLSVLLVLAVSTTAHAATPEQCGDADLSGSRTVTDGVLVLRTAADLSGGCTVESRCDIDGNGSITVTDGVAALRLAAGLALDPQCADLAVDRSRFQVFDFSHRLSFGYCPRVGAPTRFILGRNGDDIFRDAIVLVEGTPGDPDCLPDVMPQPATACVKNTTLPSRRLTEEEKARVTQIFATVRLEQEQSPDCGRVPVEPCLIENFDWDAFQVTDFPCGEPHLAPDQAAELNELIQSLL